MTDVQLLSDFLTNFLEFHHNFKVFMQITVFLSAFNAGCIIGLIFWNMIGRD